MSRPRLSKKQKVLNLLSKGENVTITFKKEGLAEAKIISFSQDHMKKKIEEDDPESESTI